ncbi:CBL-interacting serine/threonine-protein kinase 8-like [Cucurbita maxima]|uniref:non-specific serine/threonine protein kinase n=1 Tax=Cucurbita maxima TaxID=3661 RepID=A0A6J1K5A5_CUCMA|nr:CBL-interacting serine/threonine-protein kinase 8-like [Cucurbita maxima]
MVVRKVGIYEVGRTIGEGTFAEVKFAQNTETGESVAMKVLDRSTIIKHKMVDQVLASRTKIYIILEYITGGELFDKIVHHGRLSEAESRKYFQQLIDGVDYCHSKGVYHRDLKGVNLLRTTCGTPNYVAPEAHYNSALKFFVVLNLICPVAISLVIWRITIEQVREDEWFKKNYVSVKLFEDEDEQRTEEQRGNEQQMSPLILDAFDLIVLSQGLNLGAMFDRGQDSMKYPTRFVSQKPAKVLLSTVEVVAQSMGFKTHIRNYKMRVEGPSASKTSYFSVIMEFYKSLYSNLEDIIWKPSIDTSKSRIAKNKSKKR